MLIMQALENLEQNIKIKEVIARKKLNFLRLSSFA